MMAADKLDMEDADQLRDAADRAERLAKTARRIAATDEEAAGLLTDLAARAEALAFSATATARWVEEHER
jgi:hypothetical protein